MGSEPVCHARCSAGHRGGGVDTHFWEVAMGVAVCPGVQRKQDGETRDQKERGRGARTVPQTADAGPPEDRPHPVPSDVVTKCVLPESVALRPAGSSSATPSREGDSCARNAARVPWTGSHVYLDHVVPVDRPAGTLVSTCCVRTLLCPSHKAGAERTMPRTSGTLGGARGWGGGSTQEQWPRGQAAASRLQR